MAKQGKSIEEVILERKFESLKYQPVNNIVETLTPLRKKFNKNSASTSSLFSPSPTPIYTSYSTSTSTNSFLTPITNEQINTRHKRTSAKQQNSSDKEIIESLLEHSRALQERNKVRICL